MKRLTILTLMVISFCLLVSCGGGTGTNTAEPTGQATAPIESYPPPATSVPESYPIHRATPTLFSYPANATVWMTKPVGVQCRESQADLEAEVIVLESAGIPVIAFEMTNLAVCQACDVCPTSEHYRVQISKNQQNVAINLGWQVQP